MSAHLQEPHPVAQLSQEIPYTTCNYNIGKQQSLTQSSVQSTQSNTSSSTDSQTNERYLSQQIRTTQVTVNLIDCMECYVRTARCTSEQPVCDFTANLKIDMVQQVQEYRQEQEKASQTQVNPVKSQTVQDKIETRPDDSTVHSNDENEMTSLLIVDLPWSQPSQQNSADDDQSCNI
ncbi:unnamed protein product [Rotaria sp. Silwood1]|nr:unnamed protein product [Rotaria sp. Silwood1]